MANSRDPGLIHDDERDFTLQTRWQRDRDYTPPTWKSVTSPRYEEWTDRYNHYYTRSVVVGGTKLAESIVGFPSAPIYGVHRKSNYKVPLNRVHYFNLRFYRLHQPNRKSWKAKRIYFFHNGLNEVDRIDFYQELAKFLLANDPDALCILKPFPGHLSRHPFPMHSGEPPLATYLNDPGNLFRQFMRHMIEMRWLLSALAPSQDYALHAGLPLMADSRVAPRGHRGITHALAGKIEEEWRSIYSTAVGSKGAENASHVSKSVFVGLLNTIRHIAGWQVGPTSFQSAPESAAALRPAMHMIGYSLGGYLAQSAFFTWPYAISSCSTICSGGALRDVALTAFAHPEEWQTVIHGVGYELLSAVSETSSKYHVKRKGPTATIAGLDASVFSCFYHIFRDVFVQESRGSYRSRVAEYLPRLFFVVGGQDPIVNIDAVTRAAPDGANIVQIADLTHFPTGSRQPEWRNFWLPRVCDTLSEFSKHTEQLTFESASRFWGKLEGEDAFPRLASEPWKPDYDWNSSRAQPDPLTGDEALDAPNFQDELYGCVDSAGTAGQVLVFRNDLPAVFLGSQMLLRRGSGMYHSDAKIYHYIHRVSMRRHALHQLGTRLVLVLPKQLSRWFFSGKQPIFSSKLEAASFQVPSSGTLAAIWSNFEAEWAESSRLLWFDARKQFEDDERIPQPPRNLPANQTMAALWEHAHKRTINSLPDIWVSMTADAIGGIRHARAVQVPMDGLSAAMHLGAKLLPGSTDKRKSYYRELLGELLDSDQVRIVRVSGATYNQRFMGWRVRSLNRAVAMLSHAAIALARSRG